MHRLEMEKNPSHITITTKTAPQIGKSYCSTSISFQRVTNPKCNAQFQNNALNSTLCIVPSQVDKNDSTIRVSK
jgi:hypothetical protein